MLAVMLLPMSFSCSSTKLGRYMLNEADAASAIREMLSLGASNNSLTGAFGKDVILSSLFPESAQKALTTLSMLGLAGDIDRFTTTLSQAAEKTATASVPVFVNGINKMKFTDAMNIIKSTGTPATDYLKTNVGNELRLAIRPQMQAVLDEYKLNEQWNKILQPAQSIFGSKFKPDLAYIMSMVVSDAMFRKIAEKETEVRNNAAARTTPLLQKVFSRIWS